MLSDISDVFQDSRHMDADYLLLRDETIHVFQNANGVPMWTVEEVIVYISFIKLYVRP